MLRNYINREIKLLPLEEEFHIDFLLLKWKKISEVIPRREERNVREKLVKLHELGVDWLKALPCFQNLINGYPTEREGDDIYGRLA